MIKNNNYAVIKRMAKTNLKSNRRRSITMIFAVLLSVFLLFSVFTVGATYLKMQKLQNIRLNGADFDAIMYGITENQKTLLETNEEVEQYGILTVVGAVKETAMDKTPGVGLLYADPVLWNEMMTPARSYMKGNYPTEENEILVTKTALKKCGFQDKHADPVLWNEMMTPARSYMKGNYPTEENEILVTKTALKKCGFQDKHIGDQITFVYEKKETQQEKTFRISGIWDGFGSTDNFYVSKSFCKNEGIDELYNSRCNISFHRKWMSEEKQQDFIEYMHLQKSQRLFYVYEFGNAMEIFLGLAGVILVTCFSAYLLIYNIMYLSVAGNIRYYGLLQTIGMTGKQIRMLIKRQMMWIGGIGSVLGLLFGIGVSFFLIPVVIESTGMQQGKFQKIQVVFHPVIFLLTIVLTGVTVWCASRKPMKIAEASSPIEALGYRQISGKTRKRKTSHGNLIRCMAVEQLTRNKKKTLLTMLSLATSLTVFICLITLLHTQLAREYNYNYMGLDMVIENDTIQNVLVEQDDQDAPQIQGAKQIISNDILKQIRNTEGVSEILPISCVPTVIPWDPDVTDIWMREFYETWMDIPYEDDIEEYKEHPENFGSSLVGITETDFRALNAELEYPVDETAFLNGKTCILYRNGLYELDDQKLIGKILTCGEYTNPENTRSFKIAGITEINDYTALLGYPPTMIVIDHAVNEFAEEPIVFKAGIRYQEEFQKATEDAIQNILLKSPDATDFSWESKIELAEEVEKAQGHMMEIGMGIVVILAVIGFMNYINTSVGNIFC